MCVEIFLNIDFACEFSDGKVWDELQRQMSFCEFLRNIFFNRRNNEFIDLFEVKIWGFLGLN